MRSFLTVACRVGSALTLVAGPRVVAAQAGQTLPAGTSLPVRFLHPLTSGVDTVGTPVLLQTLAAVARDSCVLVPAYNELAGHVTVSRQSGRFGRGGSLALQLDSLSVSRGQWVGMRAVLESLEYTPNADLTGGGLVKAHRRPGAQFGPGALPLAAMAAGAITVVPAAVVGGLTLSRRGPSVRILAGEVGSVRLEDPMVLHPPPHCDQVRRHTWLRETPSLPGFSPRTGTRHQEDVGDPINLLLRGPRPWIDSAFLAAGWVPAHPPSVGAISKEVLAALAQRPAHSAPVSTQYLGGRPQDLAYERAGPSARKRHHVRFWLVDTTALVWAGAADEDIGLLLRPLHLPTHRIDPQIDRERDLIVRELEAGGCADLLDYVTVPGVPAHGRNAAGQSFITDGRAAILRARRCDAPAGVPEEAGNGGRPQLRTGP